jgi:uncharacterized membrane protein
MKQRIAFTMFAEIISAVFVFLYLYTAIDKFVNLEHFYQVMTKSPMLRPFAAVLSGLIPTVEAALAVLLIIPRTRRIGLWGATRLIFIFAAYIFYMLITSSDLPCTCGGIIQELTWAQHLVLNLGLMVSGVIALKYTYKKNFIAIEQERSRTPA